MDIPIQFYIKSKLRNLAKFMFILLTDTNNIRWNDLC